MNKKWKTVQLLVRRSQPKLLTIAGMLVAVAIGLFGEYLETMSFFGDFDLRASLNNTGLSVHISV